MADVTGPISSLPGSLHKVPTGMICDTEGHENVLAVKRIQGESDSLGAELIDMCQACYDKYLAEIEEPEAKNCDWCNCLTMDIKPTRDPDEGSCGPVYYVCSGCRRAQNDRFSAELESQY